jgi:hypothetical protein
MPALKNPRHELFVRNRAEGMPASKAYIAAGFQPKTPEAAWAAASRLLRDGKVRARLRELIDELAETVVVTRESLAMELDAAAEQAAELDQPSARIQAAMAKAKLFGLAAPSKQLNVNLAGSFSQMTDDELHFELASMFNEVRAAAGEPPIPLPPPPKDKQN